METPTLSPATKRAARILIVDDERGEAMLLEEGGPLAGCRFLAEWSVEESDHLLAASASFRCLPPQPGYLAQKLMGEGPGKLLRFEVTRSSDLRTLVGSGYFHDVGGEYGMEHLTHVSGEIRFVGEFYAADGLPLT